MGVVERRVRQAGKLASGLLSSLLFGNDIGIANNLRGRKVLADARAASSAQASRQEEARARTLRETGILALPDFYAKPLMERIVGRLREMFLDPRTSKPRDTAILHDVPQATRNLRYPLRTLPELKQIVSPQLVSILESYYGSHARVVALQVYRNAHIDLSDSKAREIFSSAWHFDRQHSAYVQLMVLFSDGVTRETGAYATHDIPSSKRLVRSGYVTRNRIFGPARRRIEDSALVKYFEGGIGDAMLTNNTLCLHRAGIPKEGSIRDVIMVHFEPAEVPMGENWTEELEPLPGDDGFLVRRDRPVYNASTERLHPKVVAYYEEMERQIAAEDASGRAAF